MVLSQLDASKNCQIWRGWHITQRAELMRAGFIGPWLRDIRIGTGFAAVFALRGRSSAIEPGETLEVIRQVGHADLEARAGDADGPNDEPHSVFLVGKDMLDLSAGLRAAVLALAMCSGSARLGNRF